MAIRDWSSRTIALSWLGGLALEAVLMAVVTALDIGIEPAADPAPVATGPDAADVAERRQLSGLASFVLKAVFFMPIPVALLVLTVVWLHARSLGRSAAAAPLHRDS